MELPRGTPAVAIHDVAGAHRRLPTPSSASSRHACWRRGAASPTPPSRGPAPAPPCAARSSRTRVPMAPPPPRLRQRAAAERSADVCVFAATEPAAAVAAQPTITVNAAPFRRQRRTCPSILDAQVAVSRRRARADAVSALDAHLEPSACGRGAFRRPHMELLVAFADRRRIRRERALVVRERSARRELEEANRRRRLPRTTSNTARRAHRQGRRQTSAVADRRACRSAKRRSSPLKINHLRSLSRQRARAVVVYVDGVSAAVEAKDAIQGLGSPQAAPPSRSCARRRCASSTRARRRACRARPSRRPWPNIAAGCPR